MRNFKELKVWQKGFDLTINCYHLTQEFPPSERFGLVSQINRAAVSIPSNIAEGSSRKSTKQQLYFMQIALGSCFELETQFLIAKSLHYKSPELIDAIIEQVKEIEKMLSGFCNALERSLEGNA